MAQPSYPQLPTGLSGAADPPIARVMDAETQSAFGNLCRWLRERLAPVLYALNRLLVGDTDGLQFSQRATVDASPENGMLRYFDAAVLGTEGFWLREDGSWKKVPDVPGGAASIYWDKTATVVHPKLATDDVSIGGVDSGAPIFFDVSTGELYIEDTIRAKADTDLVIKMGDHAGVSKVLFGDDEDTTVASIDSDGKMSFIGGGYIDPVQIGAGQNDLSIYAPDYMKFQAGYSCDF